jgi:transposase
MSRFRVLQPHLEQNTSLRVVAAEAGLAFRTAQRWVAQYRASGLSALVRKSRGDCGARRIVSETIKTAVEGLALESHRIPVTSVHRQIKEFAEATGDTAPGYWTVYDVVRELPPSLRALAHRGAKSYGESFDLIHRREATKPNSIWQADHAQLDINLLKEDGWRSLISTATVGQTSWLPVPTRRMRSASAPNRCQADSGGSRWLAAWRTEWVHSASIFFQHPARQFQPCALIQCALAR